MLIVAVRFALVVCWCRYFCLLLIAACCWLFVGCGVLFVADAWHVVRVVVVRCLLLFGVVR